MRQSPIAWYAQQGRWDLAPGYRGQNLHFDRPILAGCLFCHTNRFEFAEGRPPTFHGLSIGCERCHGPGALHDGRAKGADEVDLTIVNPADLAPALRDAVCEDPAAVPALVEAVEEYALSRGSKKSLTMNEATFRPRFCPALSSVRKCCPA